MNFYFKNRKVNFNSLDLKSLNFKNYYTIYPEIINTKTQVVIVCDDCSDIFTTLCSLKDFVNEIDTHDYILVICQIFDYSVENVVNLNNNINYISKILEKESKSRKSNFLGIGSGMVFGLYLAKNYSDEFLSIVSVVDSEQWEKIKGNFDFINKQPVRKPNNKPYLLFCADNNCSIAVQKIKTKFVKKNFIANYSDFDKANCEHWITSIIHFLMNSRINLVFNTGYKLLDLSKISFEEVDVEVDVDDIYDIYDLI